MNDLEKLEQKYDFKYPYIYKQLYVDGMLDWFKGWNEPWTAERNWYTKIYPTLLETPPLLLHNHDFEILEFSDIDKRLSDIPDYWNPDFSFIPFAMNGAGDWYAFHANSSLEGDVPIVFAPHDEERAWYLAKNMGDFIFRQMLEYATEIGEDILEDLVGWGEENLSVEVLYHKNISAMLCSHSRYLTPEQIAVLSEIYARPLVDYDYGLQLKKPYTKRGLLGEKEMKELLVKHIGFDGLGVEFKYML